ncbi:MAG: serine hydrolase [Bacteroidetes bacterium]|nr:serine hydrolase [Bacteroidota bacterium]
MRRFLKVLSIIALVFLVIHIVLVATNNTHLYKGLANTYFTGKTGPTIDEYQIFENRHIKATDPRPWPLSKNYNKLELAPEYLKYAENLQSCAFLVFKNDSLLFEKYWEVYTKDTVSNSFSMGKTVVSILLGIAIKEGKIKSVEQLVSDFLPQYKEGMAAKLTIKDLVTMSSGFNFDEPYKDPFGSPAKAYYGDDLEGLITDYDVVKEPGKIFEYRSGTTLVLSAVLKKALGKSISEYDEEKLWGEIHAEHEALWNLDHKDGDEKSFSSYYATARDFARIGKLYMDSGRVDGKQIVPEDYVMASIQPAKLIDEFDNKPLERYGYGWWLMNYKGHKVFSPIGLNGQYVICVPDYDLIIVRLGRVREQEPTDKLPRDFFKYLDATFDMLKLK